MSEFTTIAKVGAIREGQAEAFLVGNRHVALFNVAGEYFAIDDYCPHMGASLSAGYVEDGVVTCPWHAWRFCIQDGTWCDNPKLKVNAYEVRVENEEIQIRKKTPVRNQPTGDET
jgi:nitrite reductase (NADH) small subunit/3-phenylpropionate/trans-cinnamate dioxygenase ferredoxin subunit